MIAVYENGSFALFLELPRWISHIPVESVILRQDQSDGVTFEQAGTFCASDVDDESV